MITSDISARTIAYADLNLLKRATANNILGRWGQARPLPKKKSTTITFRRYTALDSTPVILQEGVTPTGKSRSYTDYTGYLYQYGDFIRYTDVIQDTHEDPILNDNIDALGDQADEMMDKMRFGVLKAGTNVVYANGAARTDVNQTISRDIVRTVVRALEKQKAKFLSQMITGGAKINTYPIPEAYIAVCHTDLRPDIERCTGFKDPSEYAANMGMIPGEIGSVGKVRFVGDINCEPWEDGGAAKAGAGYTVLSTTGTSADVYPILVFGKDAYGVIPLAGMNAMETLINNPKATDSDPLAQRGSQGWKGWNGCVILNDSWMLRIETAAKG